MQWGFIGNSGLDSVNFIQKEAIELQDIKGLFLFSYFIGAWGGGLFLILIKFLFVFTIMSLTSN